MRGTSVKPLRVDDGYGTSGGGVQGRGEGVGGGRGAGKGRLAKSETPRALRVLYFSPSPLISRPLRRELIVVRLFQQLLNVLGGTGLLQKAAERFVAKLPRDVFQGPQVVARPVGGRDEQKQQMDLVAVEAVE